jgi:hypothetical protein
MPYPDAPRARDGSALVLALIVVAGVAALAIGLLRLTAATSARQASAVDNRQAFYLAEAGLSESYVSLGSGGTGAIASAEEPALYGGGLLWVEIGAPEPDDDENVLRLRSMAAYGRGRASLELIVEPLERPFGIFSDEGLDLSDPFLVDGFDSETSGYFAQTGLPKLALPGSHIWYPEYKMLEEDGVWYLVEALDLPADPCGLVDVYWKYRFSDLGVPDDEGQFAAYDITGAKDAQADTLIQELGLTGFFDCVVCFDRSNALVQIAGDASGSSEYAYHTSGGGSLGSNGEIELASSSGTIEIYGDVVPGPDAQAALGTNTAVSGAVEPRGERLELAPVDVPDVTILPGFRHSSGIPRVLPAADVGYEYVTLATGSEVIVQGPSALVLGDLTLENSSRLTIDNQNGSVNFYITNSAVLEPGSLVEVLGRTPADLSLQVAGNAGPIELNGTSQFHGIVYAPEAEVSLGSSFEVFGALAGRRLNLAPNSKLHFDSGISGNSGAVPLPRFIGWRVVELPAALKNRTSNPFAALEAAPEDLAGIAANVEMRSWTLKIVHWNGLEAETYEGPAEEWVAEGADSYTMVSLTPPDNDDGLWNLHANWVSLLGATRNYDGPPSGLTLFAATQVHAWQITHPE